MEVEDKVLSFWLLVFGCDARSLKPVLYKPQQASASIRALVEKQISIALRVSDSGIRG
jgi:hypothetical protein